MLGKVIYLDRHNVQCPEGTLLNGFLLKRKPGDKYGYEYKCAAAPGALTPTQL